MIRQVGARTWERVCEKCGHVKRLDKRLYSKYKKQPSKLCQQCLSKKRTEPAKEKKIKLPQYKLPEIKSGVDYKEYKSFELP